MVVACFGEILLRMATPPSQPVLHDNTFRWYAGGAEANVAVALSHLGTQAAVHSRLPSNPLGDAARRELRKHGVDVSGLGAAPGRMGMYFHATGAGARPDEVVYDRQYSAFSEATTSSFDVHKIVHDCDWLHISGVTPAVGRQAAETACVLAEAAAAAGKPFTFDFNHRAKMWAVWGGDPEPYLRRLVGSATGLFANDYDLGRVLDIPAEKRGRSLDEATRAFENYPRLQWICSAFRTVRATRDHLLSAKLVTRKGSWETQSAPLTDIVDRIGGGDAFAGTVIHGFVNGWAEERIVHAGLAASAFKHTIPGDFTVATEQDLDRIIDGAALDVQR